MHLTRWADDACRLAADMMNDLQPLRVLDVATGTGTPALYLANLWPQCRVEACDLFPESIEVATLLAQQERLTNVRFHVAAAEELSFPDGSFDLLTCFFSLMYMKSPGLVAEQFLKLVSPGGRIIITTWAGDNELFRLVKQVFGLEEYTGYPDGKNPYALSDEGNIIELFKCVPSENISVKREMISLCWEGNEVELWSFFKDSNPFIKELLTSLPEAERRKREAHICELLADLCTDGSIRFSAEMFICLVQL